MSRLFVKTKPKFPLHDAANIGNYKGLKKHIKKLKKPENINNLDERHWTCLHCAANSRNLECCKLLLENKADPQILTSTNNTALHFLVPIKEDANLKAVLDLVIKNGADVNYPTVNGFTPLHEAALRGECSTVRFLIKHKALVNFQGSSNVTPLHCAIQSLSIKNAEYLIEHGASVDVKGFIDGTPLQLAKKIFSEEQYKLFIEFIKTKRPDISEQNLQLEPFHFPSLPSNIKELAVEADIEEQSINKNFDIFMKTVSILHPELAVCPERRVAQFDSSIDPRTLYEIEEASGSGGFGRVFVARCKRTKNLVAVKILPHVEKKEIVFNQIELNSLRKSQCRNVVTLLGSFYIRETKEVWIVTEYLNGGMISDLISLLKRKKRSITESQIAFIAKQILEALVHLHANHIIHRDIKSNNIIFTKHGDLKLIDFGLSLDLNGNTTNRFQTVGSPLWISPEVVLRKPQTPAVDLWGLGLILLEICNLELPCSDNKLRALFNIGTGKLHKLAKPEKWSEEMNHFVNKCLRFDPTSRGTAELLLKHEWLEKACLREDMSKLIIVHSIMLSENINEFGF